MDGAGIEMFRLAGLSEQEYREKTGMWCGTFIAVKYGEWVSTGPLLEYLSPCPPSIISIPELKKKGWLIERNGSGVESTQQGS